MVSSSGDGVWPTRGAEASGLKCRRKRAADGEKMGRGKGAGAEGGNNTEVEGGGQLILSPERWRHHHAIYIHLCSMFMGYVKGVNTKNDQLAVKRSAACHSFQCQN